MPQGRVAAAFALFALLALVTLSGLPRAADAQAAPWIDESAANQYATNLIDSYGAFVDSNQASSPSFASTAQYFSLYHGAGDSFQVLVVRSTTLAIDSNVTDSVAFVFTPIQSSQPQVIVDDNDTLEDLVGVTLGPALYGGSNNGSEIISPLKDGTAFFQYTMQFRGDAVKVPLIWVTSISHQVLNDTAANSADAAHEIYDSDSSYVASRAASQTSQTEQASIISRIGSLFERIIPLAVILVAVLVFLWAQKMGRQEPEASEGAPGLNTTIKAAKYHRKPRFRPS